MPSPPLSIIQSLSPRIAVLTSEDVVRSCEANGCRGLEELLRPWEGGTERVSVLSSTLTPTIHPTFPLRFVSYDSVYTNPASSFPNPDVLVDLISSFVGARKPEEEQHYPLTRSLLLSSRPLAAHETFNHPVGVLFAVSTSTPDPLGTLNKLHARTTGAAAQSVPWLDAAGVLRFYVVVHDVGQMGDDMAPAHELLGNVKRAYGPHSTLLVINSQIEQRPIPPSPDVSTHSTTPLPRPFTPVDVSPSAVSQVYASALSSLTLSPMAAAFASLGDESATSDTPSTPGKPARRKMYGAKLTAEDTQRLVALVRELVVQSLVPWMEGRVREWNETYHNNRRGITGRLFGAGRKLFGSRPNSPAPGAPNMGYNVAKGYYPISAVEALSRRLADFAFMLRDYRFAANIYDSVRRDFAQDRATRYAAAATEMYGLSLLLAHTFFHPTVPPSVTPVPFTNLQHTEITSWLEQAVVAYHQRGPSTQIQLDALRVTVLYYEAWKALGEWRGVGAALVKGAGEADEVPSAVLIEEAASADTKGGKSRRGRRRCAFDLLLAARRYETAGLKAYSRRCLERASQVYRSAPWVAAQDRIEYSLGRQAYTLGESDVAVEHFLSLLRRENTGVPGSQAGPLQDMALAYEQLVAHPELLEAAKDKLQLPTPVFDIKRTRITASSSSVSRTSRAQWEELEAQAFSSWDRKGKKPISLLPDENRSVVRVNEPFTVELVATNPLNSKLVLANLTATFTSPDGADHVTVERIQELALEPYESRLIALSAMTTTAITLRLSTATFLFHNFFPCAQPLERRGKRLHATKAQRMAPTYAEDPSLSVSVLPVRARVEVDLEGMPDVVYEGEEVRAVMRVVNKGNAGIEDVTMVWSEEGMVRRDGSDDTKHNNIFTSTSNRITLNSPTSLYPGIVPPGETAIVPVILTAARSGHINLCGLIIFSSTDDGDSEAAAVMVERQVDVLPLAQLKTTVKPRGDDAAGYVMALEVANVSGEAIKVEGVYGVSAVWGVEVPQHGDSTVLPNQTLRTVFTVKQTPGPEVDLRQRAVVDALGLLIRGQPPEEVTAELPPTTSLASLPPGELGPAYLSSRRAHRLAYLSRSFPTLSPASLPQFFPLFDPLDLDLVVAYSILSSDRRGYLPLHALRPSPAFSVVEDLRRQVDAAIASGSKQTRTMYEETGRLRRVLMDSVLDGVLGREVDPVTVRVGAGERGMVRHDFKDGACKVPVTFDIQNRSPHLPVRWILRLPTPSAAPSTTSDPSPLSPPRFIGTLAHRGTLPPGGSERVNKEVWVHEPSLVVLDGWELAVETGEREGEDDGAGGWRARMSWTRVGGEKVFEVRG